uniref:AlNc14C1G133 protein n=1 Tax=Albugo laibachii Nc14 TaxID=890382 RepID=F0VYY6_9STRA|nr:AlNc14C1G133 [Albugo laibachii Nc14]|eukprot:CCA14001.1 AlNc14C1G133 [Albugo laibachii Nc14]
MASLVNQRRCSYKKGIDSESIRKRRENVSIQVRKHAKDQKLQQRRRLNHVRNTTLYLSVSYTQIRQPGIPFIRPYKHPQRQPANPRYCCGPKTLAIPLFT